MTNSEFSDLLARRAAQLAQACRRTIPIQIGRIASDMFKANFQNAGFTGNGFTPWAVTRRQQSGGEDAGSQYTPLLSAQNHLMSSIQYVPSDFAVVISNPVPYAAIHNEGGTINPTVSPQMRRFAWAMYYRNGGKDSPAAERWKALALTKKPALSIRIPKRQFMGDSPELQEKISQRIQNTIKEILNS